MFHDPGRYRDDRDADRREAHDLDRYDRRAFDRDEDYPRREGWRDPGDRRDGEARSFGGREPFVPAWAEPASRDRDDRDGDRDRREAFEFGRTDRRYSREDTRRRLPREETERLIASDKVEGAPVYDLNGDRVGRVENFMVDKRSGRVEYAVVRMRGGLVHGEAWRPVDWADLAYDEGLDGYRLDLDRQALRRRREHERGR